MDKPFEDPTHGIRVINVAIGYLAESTNDCNLQIKRLNMVKRVLETVEDGSWVDLKDDGIDQLQSLYDSVLAKASAKVGKHVRVFEHESHREDYQGLIGEDGTDTDS